MFIEGAVEQSVKVVETVKSVEGVVIQEGSEVQEIIENTKTLEIDLEVIQTTSLEALEKANLEKQQAQEIPQPELRELTEEEKQKLREENNLPENLLNAIRVDETGNYYVKCTNEKLEGLEHPETGVRFTEKTIEINGVKITVIVPEFPCLFEIDVPPELWMEGDSKVFKYCTEKLREYLNEHPEQKANFTPEQLRMIERGMPRIPGLSWHHNETPGKMQLVDFKTHDKTGHTGGNHLWCGGIR